MTLYDVYPSFVVVFILIVWFETNAIYEYLAVFKTYNPFAATEEKKQIISSYPNYLLINYPNFFTKLLSCPICFGFWLNILCCSLVYQFGFFFVNFYISLLLYSILVKTSK